MKKFLLFILILSSYVNAYIDCSKTKDLTNTEKMICTPMTLNLDIKTLDSQLEELNRTLAYNYNRIKEDLNSNDRDSFTAQQKKWIVKKDKTCNLKDEIKIKNCLYNLYKERNDYIKTKYKKILNIKKDLLSFYEGVIDNKTIGLEVVITRDNGIDNYEYEGYFFNTLDKNLVNIHGKREQDNFVFSDYEHKFIGKISNKQISGTYKYGKVNRSFHLKQVTRKRFFNKFNFLNVKIEKRTIYENGNKGKEDAGFGSLRLIKNKGLYRLTMFKSIGAPSYNYGYDSGFVQLKNNIAIRKINDSCSFVLFLLKEGADVIEIEKGDDGCKYIFGHGVYMGGYYSNVNIYINSAFNKKLKKLYTILKTKKSSEEKINALNEIRNFAIKLSDSDTIAQPAYIEALKNKDENVLRYAIKHVSLDEESIPLLLKIIINNSDTSPVFKLDDYFGCNGCIPSDYGYIIQNNIDLAKKALTVLKEKNIELYGYMKNIIDLSSQ